MSGWVRIDKDLPDEIRFRRMVKAWQTASGEDGNGAVTRYARDVTMLLGALMRLWMYADSHIAEDNTLELTPDELDEMVGVPHFAASLPEDWLRDVGNGRMELPDFLDKNGTSAKQRSDNARRQAKHRERIKVRGVTRDSNGSNGSNASRPDQTRLDQTREKSARAAGEGEADVPHGTFDGWAFVESRMQPVYPDGTYRKGHWTNASRVIERQLSDGEISRDDLDAVIAGSARYLAQAKAKGEVGTQFICNPERFLLEFRWREEFPLPAPRVQIDPRRAAEQQQRHDAEQRERAELAQRAEAIGFRSIGEDEALQVYRTLLQREERDRRSRQGSNPVTGVVASLAASKSVGGGR